MGEVQTGPTGPDLTKGIAIDAIADGGMLAGHVDENAVLLARDGEEFFAVGAHCSHYGGPLVDGLRVGDTVRCPWHHWNWQLTDGKLESDPRQGVRTYEVAVEGNDVILRA